MEGKSRKENTTNCLQLKNPRVFCIGFALFVCLFFRPTRFECFCIPLPHLVRKKVRLGTLLECVCLHANLNKTLRGSFYENVLTPACVQKLDRSPASYGTSHNAVAAHDPLEV